MSDRRRAGLILASLLLTFVVIRLAMWRSPDSDFGLAGYNIHHLFTGVLLSAAASIPLILRPGRSRGLDLACIAFGAGLSLALDEVVYLIANDRERVALRWSSVALAIQVFGCAALIPLFGAAGAAAGMAIGEAAVWLPLGQAGQARGQEGQPMAVNGQTSTRHKSAETRARSSPHRARASTRVRRVPAADAAADR